MFSGRLMGEIPVAEADERAIGLLMAGVQQEVA
jgi:hypothetical protein